MTFTQVMIMKNEKPAYLRPFDLNPKTPLTKEKVSDALVQIWREYDARLPGSFSDTQEFGLTKNEAAKNFLRREIFSLGIALRQRPPKWSLSELIASMRSHRSTRQRLVGDGIFNSLLMGVYEEDSTISRQERWLMSRELEYAYLHRVPPRYLCGFLYQSGGRKGLLKKLEADFREPAFRSDAKERDAAK